MRLASEEVLNGFYDLRHAGHTADEDDFVDFPSRKAGVLQGSLTGAQGPLDQIAYQRFQLRPGQLDIQVLRAALIRSDEGEVDLRRLGGRQLDLCLLCGFLEALQRELVLAQVDTLLLFELLGEVLDDLVVEVFTTQESITIGGLYFEDPVTDLQDRDVEGTAAQVIDSNSPRLLLFKPVSERSSRGFVDNPQNLDRKSVV